MPRHRTLRAQFCALLREADGDVVPTIELIDLLWGFDPNGGPDDASNTIRQMAFGLRQRGHPVVGVIGRNGGYRWDADAMRERVRSTPQLSLAL